MAELILGPMIGGLNHNSCYVWGRSDNKGVLHAWLGQVPDLSDAALAGSSIPLREEDGYAGVVPLIDLEPNRRYYYALTLGATLGEPGSLYPPADQTGHYPSFTTFPLPGSHTSFSFAFGSCFRPGTLKAGQIFLALDRCRREFDYKFLLSIGDQIYADDVDANGIGKIARTTDDYRNVYQYVWSQKTFRELLYNFPVFMMLDDHEVDDDWRWVDEKRQFAYIPWWNRLVRLLNGRPFPERRIHRSVIRSALQAYWEHQGMHAPELTQPLKLTGEGQYELDSHDKGSLAYTFEFGAAAFFVMDTRTMRVRGSKNASVLGEDQWIKLENWLLGVKETPVKFLVSSSALIFHMWADVPKDRWSGFPGERDRLLEFIASNSIKGVFVLSGDLHAAHAMRVELEGSAGQEVTLWEFCSSPYEQMPNRWARRTYTPVRSSSIKLQECSFIYDDLNFGEINVNYHKNDRVEVQFRLFDKNGEFVEEVIGT